MLTLIGKYQSDCTLPHQSESPFVGERSFSTNNQCGQADFSFPSPSPLPLPPPQFFFLPPTGLVNFSPRPNSPLFPNSRWRPERPMGISTRHRQNPPALQATPRLDKKTQALATEPIGAVQSGALAQIPSPRDFSCTSYQNPSLSQPSPETKHYFFLRNSFWLIISAFQISVCFFDIRAQIVSNYIYFNFLFLAIYCIFL